MSAREGAGGGEFAHNRFPLRVCEFSEGDEEFGALSGLWKPPDERYRHHWSEHSRDRGHHFALRSKQLGGLPPDKKDGRTYKFVIT